MQYKTHLAPLFKNARARIHPIGRFAVTLGLALSLVATQGVRSMHAQDLDCETDPLIVVTANDGTQLNLHLYQRASLRLSDNLTVTQDELVSHLKRKTRVRPISAERVGSSYEVVIEGSIDSWSDGTTFPVTTWLSFKPAQISGPTSKTTTPQSFRNTISIPRSALSTKNARSHNSPEGSNGRVVGAGRGW